MPTVGRPRLGLWAPTPGRLVKLALVVPLVFASCSGPATATPTAGPTGSSGSAPTVTCHGRPSTPDPLTCDAAIAAVRLALGPRVADVMSYEFAFGFYCPHNEGCRVPIPANGFVIVAFTNGASAVASVKAADDGSVDVLSIVDKAVLD